MSSIHYSESSTSCIRRPQAFKRLFLSPSEANDKSYSHTRQDITKVNFASIAWTATMVSLCIGYWTVLLMGSSCDQVRFALSSDSRFEYSPKSPLAFHYQKFYNNLMYLFEDPKQSVDACSLLDWWNRYEGFTVVCVRLLKRIILPVSYFLKRRITTMRRLKGP